MVTDLETRLRERIRTVADFPKKGIMFRDITTLLQDESAFREVNDCFYERYRAKGIVKVAGIESRGFIFASVLASRLGAGFVPVRKPNKLPSAKIREEYALEYGTDALEVHTDAVTPGERVLVVDDLLATGGTARASCALITRLGGIVAGAAFLIELAFLHGRDKLKDYDVFSIVTYESE